MTAGRRVLPSALFLAAAVLLTPETCPAQEGSHKVWSEPLTPDQIRAALAKMGAGEFGLDPFQDMVKDFLLKNNPGLDKDKAADTIKKLTGNKDLMEQLKKFAQEKRTDPGRPPRFTPEQLGEFFRRQKERGELPKLPDDLKGFDLPKIGAGGDPKVGPVPDPKVGPGPRPQPEPKGDPGAPPDFPDLPRPPGPDKLKLDENPFPLPNEQTDPQSKSFDAITSLWERNIGSLDENPEVRRALMDLFQNNNFDLDIRDASGNSLWDVIKDGGADGGGFGDLLNNPGGGSWDFGKWEWPKFGNWFGGSNRSDGGGGGSSWFGGGSSRPRPSGGGGGGGLFGGGGGFGLGGLGGVWLPFVLLLLVVLAVVVWLKLKDLKREGGPVAVAGGLGGWPIDPTAINTREDVVLAFEYLSVLICGPSAKNWTHGTIAEALADLATTHEETAVMLARLYELARYAPLDEPLTRAEVLEARELVCSLAGV